MAQSVFENVQKDQDPTSAIVSGLERISNIFRSLLSEQAREHKLSPLQIQIMLFIHFESKEQNNPVLLAKKLNLSKATISIALKSMEQKRLITKKKNEPDLRSYSVALTDWGKQIAHIAGFYPEPLRKVISPISARDKDILLKNIRGIIGKLS